MPFGSVVSIGRGSFTFRMSFETGARFSRSTLLVGIDLSSADPPWLHPVATKEVARITATAACIKKLILKVRLIDFPFRPHRAISLSRLPRDFLFAFIEPAGIAPLDSSKRRFA